jgi:hypothetical protein
MVNSAFERSIADYLILHGCTDSLAGIMARDIIGLFKLYGWQQPDKCYECSHLIEGCAYYHTLVANDTTKEFKCPKNTDATSTYKVVV